MPVLNPMSGAEGVINVSYFCCVLSLGYGLGQQKNTVRSLRKERKREDGEKLGEGEKERRQT
ncbi:hypothetical protein LX32DRAFT_643319 [Colletotrichum zoysiae]|uniref:Uncharacterized protein n=1 Tax=Colletotrichum zoysiae TaxID=1216348 RepID=A0AAD9HAJ6_9PEZI|nr:hypothetical protein LX32DRAFT_643319 [Colletotrichum zoysiae]